MCTSGNCSHYSSTFPTKSPTISLTKSSISLSNGALAGVIIGSIFAAALIGYLVFKLILPNLAGGKATVGRKPDSVNYIASTNPLQ